MNEITLESLIAGALLKFGTVDSLDIALLMGGLKNVTVVDYIDGLKQYMQYKQNIIRLKPEYTLDTNISPTANYLFPLRKYLNRLQGPIVKNYLENLNLIALVLKKIQISWAVPKNNLKNMFNDVELAIVNELLALNHIDVRWNDDVPYEDYEEIFVTKQGEVELYMYDNQEAIQSFQELLVSYNYNPYLIKDFLMSLPDLNSYVLDKRSIGDFELFGSLYDRSVLK